MGQNKIIKAILLAGGGAVLFFLVFYPKIIGLPEVSLKTDTKGNLTETVGRPFDSLNLEAKAVLVFDLVKNEPIFELNPNTQLPLASLTKIMTVVLAEEILPAQEKNNILNDIDAALSNSSNKAASNIAALAKNFIDLMNRKAEELNLNQTYFLNETGLDISNYINGGYGSVHDIAKLINYALKTNPDLFEITTNGPTTNTNPYASTTTLLIASKTGLTDLAGGNLAVVFDAGFNHPIVSVVLGSSEKGRFLDTQKLIEATFRYLVK